jgi:hypothetical protein
MYRLKKVKDLRESRLYQLQEQISATVLVQDEVVPPHGVSNTLRGGRRKINTRVDVLDFEFPYDHVIPFPLTEKYQTQVDKSFRKVMDSTSAFLS